MGRFADVINTHFNRRFLMQDAQVVGQDRAQKQKNGQFGKSEKKRPSRYFVDGRIPPNVETAQKRLALIKQELKHTSDLVDNAVDINTERHNNRKKFIDHTRKEISSLTEWIENNSKAAGTKKPPMSAREKILDTLNFLIALDNKGQLLASEKIVLEMLIDYSVQG